jgi:hypothetical protein
MILRRGLDAVTAALYFYKMYSNGVGADYINLKMTVSPVPLKYRMSLFFQQAACNVFALLPY